MNTMRPVKPASRTSSRLLAVAVLGFWLLTAVAAEPAGNVVALNIPESYRLSLGDVISSTYERNPSHPLFAARLNEAAAVRRQAGALFADDPAVQIRHNTGQVGNIEGLREWEWGVEMPLWLPGQKDARRRVADTRELSVTTSETALRLLIAQQVRELLWAISTGQNETLLAHKAWQTAQELETDVSRRYEAGELARLDQVLARQETLDRKEQYLRARASLIQDYDRYRILTGLEQIPVTFSEQLTDVRQITSEHPAIADAMATVATEQARRDRAQTERRANPSVMVGTRHERPIANADYENTLGITVRVPFGLPVYSAPEVAATETAVADASTQRDLLKRELDIKLQQARDRLTSTRASLEVAREHAELARENLALIRRSFDLGETDLFDLLRVQSRAFSAELNLRLTEIQLEANIARYNQAAGILP